jgi:hypothetical protein
MRAIAAVIASCLLVLVTGSSAVAAPPWKNPPPRDTQPPTAPTSLHTTSVGQTTVSLAWGQSTDDRQVLFYGAWAPGLSVVYVDHPSTTATFTGLHPGTTYEFRVQAWDGFNWSWPTPILNVTTSPDVVAPTAPSGLAVGSDVHGFPVDGVTASTVLLNWDNATDDFGPIRYEVLVDGVVSPDVYDTRPAGIPVTSRTVAWVRQLPPGRVHTFAVRTVDGGGNRSAPSAPITVTTDPSTDTVAPTVPTLTRADGGGTGTCPEELWLRWTGSVDDVDPVLAIEYEVRVNGTINEVVPGGTQTITYTEVSGDNVVTIVAVDRSGNASAPSNAMTVGVNWGPGCAAAS